MKSKYFLITAILLLTATSNFAQLNGLLKKVKTTSGSNSNTGSGATQTSTTQGSGTFREGDRVEVNYRELWRKGTVNQMSSAGRVQVQLDEGGPTMWMEANTVRAIDEPNRADVKKALVEKRPYKVNDFVEWTNKSDLRSFGKVSSIPNESQVYISEEGNSEILKNNSDVAKSIPGTGKFKAGERVAVVGLGGYDMATIREAGPGGYRLEDANINVSRLWHEKDLYRFNEESFKAVTAPIAALLDKLQAIAIEKYGYFSMTGSELKTALSKIEELQRVLQPERDNLPFTTKFEWKKNPNYALSLLQLHKELIYLDVCNGDTTITASQALVNELEALPTDYVELWKLGDTPGTFMNFFTLKNGYDDYDAKYKDYRNNRVACLEVLGKTEKNDFTLIKTTYDKKAAALMTSIKTFSDNFKFEMNAHNPALEALAKAAFLKTEPGASVLKSWLVDPVYKIRSNSLGIPEYKYLLVHLLVQVPKFKTQFYVQVDVVSQYSGGGSYAAPKATHTPEQWAYKEYLIGK